MTDEYSVLVDIAKEVNPHGFSVSKADRDDKDWHFSFKRSSDAGEFAYRLRCHGFQATLNVHGDVWVEERKDAEASSETSAAVQEHREMH